MTRKRSLATRVVSQLPEPDTWSFSHGDHELWLYRWAKQEQQGAPDTRRTPEPQRTADTPRTPEPPRTANPSRAPNTPRVLLVHGIGMGHLTFDGVIEALLPHTEVIAVDLPGFGDSPEPEHAGTMAQAAELVAAAIIAADLGPVTAVGHSMGAQVVAELCAAHPNLAPRAVLFAPAVNARERTVAKQAFRLVQDLLEGKPLLAIVMGLIEYGKAGPRWFLKMLKPTIEHRIEDRLPSIAQPVLVLCGSQDRVTPPEWCLTVSQLLPRGAFGVLAGVGHEAMIARGESAAQRVLEWAQRSAHHPAS